MKSFTTPEFWHSYAALSSTIRQEARKTYRLWQADPQYPSLHFKKISGNLWSVRVTRDYRALALKKKDGYYWIWIGTHSEYDKLLKS